MTRKQRIDQTLARAHEQFEAHPTTKLLRARMEYHRA
jgi:hypothetical protein